ncbi:MAG: hypothetical protein ACLFWG_06770 [Longimicrobiales bacterium]
MAGDDLDLSEFEEFSSTAKERSRKGRSNPGSDPGTKGGDRGPRRWVWLLAGLVLGAAAAVFGPELAAPYLPRMLQPGGEEATGPVVGKRLEGDRVLLTVDTEQGALLATFRQRVPEIDLLVEEGDTVTLGIPAYAPLVEDPTLAAVRKGRGGEVPSGPPAAPGSGGGEPGISGSEDSVPPDSENGPNREDGSGVRVPGQDEASPEATDSAGA